MQQVVTYPKTKLKLSLREHPQEILRIWEKAQGIWKNKKKNIKTKKTAQDMQDEIFRKMPAEKKIRLALELTSFCLKLNSFNGNIKSRKTSY